MNKKQTKTLLLLITIIIGGVIISGCISDEENKIGEEGMNETNDYYPLEVGNQWEYVMKTEVEEESPQISIMTVKIINKEIINDTETLVIENKGGNIAPQIFYVNKEDGKILCYKKILNGKESYPYPPQLLFDFSSLKNGKKWKWIDENKGIESEGEILGKEVINVPAGRFETYKMKITYQPTHVAGTERAERTIWFAKNVGVVKDDTHIIIDVPLNNKKRYIDNNRIIVELKRYNISTEKK